MGTLKVDALIGASTPLITLAESALQLQRFDITVGTSVLTVTNPAIPYKSNIRVFKNGVEISGTWAGATQVTISPAAVAGDVVHLYSVAGAPLQVTKNLSDIQNVPAARTNLGLGDAALGTKTVGARDTTAERLLKVGDYGLGLSPNQVAIPALAAVDQTTDLNSIVNAGWYYALVGGAPGARNPNFPDGQAPLGAGSTVVNYYYLHVTSYGGNITQVAYPYVSGSDTTTATPKFRMYGGGTWSPWRTMYHDGMFTGRMKEPEVLWSGSVGGGGVAMPLARPLVAGDIITLVHTDANFIESHPKIINAATLAATGRQWFFAGGGGVQTTVIYTNSSTITSNSFTSGYGISQILCYKWGK